MSLLLHALVVAAVLWGARLPITERWRPKPGDALIVELPKPDEPASAGSPSAPPGPVTPEAPPNRAKTPPPATPAPPARPAPPAPRQVAAAPRAPEPSRPAPKPSESPRPVDAPRPVDTPRPAEPSRPTPPPVSEPAETGTEKAAPSEPSATADTPRVERVPPAPRAEPANPQVASVPPPGGGAPSGPAVPDMRSALRRGGGGRGEGRGGILGDPIPLDTPDPKFHEFLNQVRKQIQDKLTYPCIKHPGTFECEPKDTEVIVHFGILKTGRLQFIDLYVASPWSIYDDASMTAIRLAQPFPPVPAAIMASLPTGSTGMPIAGRFRFQVTYSTLVR